MTNNDNLNPYQDFIVVDKEFDEFLQNYKTMLKKFYPTDTYYSALGLILGCAVMQQTDLKPVLKIYLDSKSPVNDEFFAESMKLYSLINYALSEDNFMLNDFLNPIHKWDYTEKSYSVLEHIETYIDFMEANAFAYGMYQSQYLEQVKEPEIKDMLQELIENLTQADTSFKLFKDHILTLLSNTKDEKNKEKILTLDEKSLKLKEETEEELIYVLLTNQFSFDPIYKILFDRNIDFSEDEDDLE